ncbi:hypothetical protein POVWA2_072410 [Plasmodium ovale wallikeri]|nr:hypothetical protein POVWA1_070120 [Plasmodium ovale wallikeri]SBT56250.1 hypothetical protein POVWA2_072410 [Plasmodium ovale wallikeri]
MLKNALYKEMSDISNNFPDDSINTLKTESERILNYCKCSKENFRKLSSARLQEIEEKTNQKYVYVEVEK